MKQYDAIVVGAGPAGLSAANRIACAGGHVVVIDMNDRPGGQLKKQIHKFFGSAEVCAGVRGIRLTEQLYKPAVENGCKFFFHMTAYAIEEYDSGYIVYAGDGENTMRLFGKAIILAVGASENTTIFPGWTKPGVITAGAAQTMVNQYRVAVGKRVLMVGAGNVGLIVSYQLLQAGIDVVAVIEAAADIGGYEVHANKLRRAGVPIYTACSVLYAEGEETVTGAVVASVDTNGCPVAGTEMHFNVDTICLAVGLSPLVKLAASCGCKIMVNKKRETIPWHNETLMTSKRGIYVAGDVAGVEEASIAIEEGQMAGVYAGIYLGIIKENSIMFELAEIKRRLAELRKKGNQRPEKEDYSKYSSFDGSKVVIECYQGIACNPCEKCCSSKAIIVGEALSGKPIIDLDKCTGCGRCVVSCPGMACFLLNMNYNNEEAEIGMPYEFLPVPKKGDTARGMDRNGQYVCDARVTQVVRMKDCDQTLLLKIAVPKVMASRVRSIK